MTRDIPTIRSPCAVRLGNICRVTMLGGTDMAFGELNDRDLLTQTFGGDQWGSLRCRPRKPNSGFQGLSHSLRVGSQKATFLETLAFLGLRPARAKYLAVADHEALRSASSRRDFEMPRPAVEDRDRNR